MSIILGWYYIGVGHEAARMMTNDGVSRGEAEQIVGDRYQLNADDRKKLAKHLDKFEEEMKSPTKTIPWWRKKKLATTVSLPRHQPALTGLALADGSKIPVWDDPDAPF